MSKRKPGVSAKRHIKIGVQLSAIRDTIVALEAELRDAYPRSGPSVPMLRKLAIARVALADVRHYGDLLACDAYPELWCRHWYHPRGWSKYGEMPHSCGANHTEATDADAIDRWCADNGTVPGPQHM